jgi:hypothetical protein
MGQIEDKILKLTHDPGVRYLAQVADAQSTTNAEIKGRLEKLEKTVADCCGGAGLSARLASTDEKTVVLKEDLGKLGAEVAGLQSTVAALKKGEQPTEKPPSS